MNEEVAKQIAESGEWWFLDTDGLIAIKRDKLARMIAAALDRAKETTKAAELSANADLLAVVEEVATILAQRNMGGWEQRLLDMARAAIAKARGMCDDDQ